MCAVSMPHVPLLAVMFDLVRVQPGKLMSRLSPTRLYRTCTSSQPMVLARATDLNHFLGASYEDNRFTWYSDSNRDHLSRQLLLARETSQ